MKQVGTPSAQILSKGDAQRISDPPRSMETAEGHKEMFGPSQGIVYANDLAKPEFEKDNPDFPVGSMIVREKYYLKDLLRPEVAIAMVKREKGFSNDTEDWEFIVLGGTDLSLKSRETKGSCADCHIQTRKSDWVFRTYLKK